MIESKLLVPILGLVLRIADLIVKKIGVPTAQNLMCKMGSHHWEAVEGEKWLRVCLNCGALDDIRTTHIDSMPFSEQRKIKRKLFRAVKRGTKNHKRRT